MSHSYFLQAHLHGGFQDVDTSRVLSVFEPFITERSDTYIDLEFDEQCQCTIYINTTDTSINSLSVNRPCSCKELAKCLFDVMLLGNFVFFEPDGKQPIVLNPVTESHMPEDMINVLGKPAVAKNLDEFWELYFNNR